MKTITYAEVQQLVTKIPETELPLVYCLLAELAVGEAQSPQAAFMRLSVDERRQVLAQQAEQMKTHYEETADERTEWQTGDFISLVT